MVIHYALKEKFLYLQLYNDASDKANVFATQLGYGKSMIKKLDGKTFVENVYRLIILNRQIT